MDIKELKELMEKEGNKEDFIYKGYKCKLRRNQMGAWCGYIQIPINPFQDIILSKNILNSLENNDVNIDIDYFDTILRPHGGITYSSKTKNNYILGFDCSHTFDLVPNLYDFYSKMHNCTYKNKEYARLQCKLMIEQLINEFKNHPLFV